MAIISQETWDNMPKAEKEKIIAAYNSFSDAPHELDYWVKKELEAIFGKGNLQPKNDSEIILYGLSGRNPQSESIQKNTEWNKCTEQEQQNILEIYNKHPEWEDVINALESKFGKHNLQPMPKIRTWEDIKEGEVIQEIQENFTGLGAHCYIDCNYEGYIPSKIINKMIATAKIAKLIELGYGGIISNEEYLENFNESHNRFWGIYVDEENNIKCTETEGVKDLLTFRTQQQAEEFMSYSENRVLVEQYYMI